VQPIPYPPNIGSIFHFVRVCPSSLFPSFRFSQCEIFFLPFPFIRPLDAGLSPRRLSPRLPVPLPPSIDTFLCPPLQRCPPFSLRRRSLLASFQLDTGTALLLLAPLVESLIKSPLIAFALFLLVSDYQPLWRVLHKMMCFLCQTSCRLSVFEVGCFPASFFASEEVEPLGSGFIPPHFIPPFFRFTPGGVSGKVRRLVRFETSFLLIARGTYVPSPLAFGRKFPTPLRERLPTFEGAAKKSRSPLLSLSRQIHIRSCHHILTVTFGLVALNFFLPLTCRATSYCTKRTSKCLSHLLPQSPGWTLTPNLSKQIPCGRQSIRAGFRSPRLFPNVLDP